MDTTLTDRDGDLLKIEEVDGGLYFTVEQNGILATVGPYAPEALARVLAR